MIHYPRSWCIIDGTLIWCMLMYHVDPPSFLMDHDASCCIMIHHRTMMYHVTSLCVKMYYVDASWLIIPYHDASLIAYWYDAYWCIMLIARRSWWSWCIMMHHESSSHHGVQCCIMMYVDASCWCIMIPYPLSWCIMTHNCASCWFPVHLEVSWYIMVYFVLRIPDVYVSRDRLEPHRTTTPETVFLLRL